MEFGARAIVMGVGSVLILLSLGSPLTAQHPHKDNHVRNIELCNGSDRTTPESRIVACTALIDAGQGTPAVAIAYNNRGNALIVKGDYERAIQDFDRSIELNGTYAK